MRKLLWHLVLSVIIIGSCAPDNRLSDPTRHSFKNAGQHIARFETANRSVWQKPDEVVRALNVKSGYNIADIGAGSGYFTRRFARAVAPSGSADGFDIEQEMVDYMKSDATKTGLKNYQAFLISPDKPVLEQSKYDLVFICNTYHHLPHRVEYVSTLSSALKKNGRVVIVDYTIEAKDGPPAHYRVPESKVVEEFSRAGYRLIKKHGFLPQQYFLEFAR